MSQNPQIKQEAGAANSTNQIPANNIRPGAQQGTATQSHPQAAQHIVQPHQPPSQAQAAQAAQAQSQTAQAQAQAQQQRKANPQFSPADLNRIVLEYLNKKGYHKTEALLRVESSHTPTPSSPAPPSAPSKAASPEKPQPAHEKFDPELYERGYSMLRTWVESSLDIYRPELYRVLYPIFIHCFLDLIEKNAKIEARRFFDKFSGDHQILHGTEISKLAGIGSPDHLKENELAKSFKDNTYILHVSRTSLNLLLYFLHENEALGGSLMINFINRYVQPKIITGRVDTDIGEGSLDDGIKGVGATDELDKFNSQAVKLGNLPMDPEYTKELEVELKRRDEKEGRTEDTLVEEFNKIKKETDDSPPKETLPLPQKTALDLKREILAVRESRDKFKLDSIQAAAPSVCMYTFHNTNNDLTTLEFNDDSTLVAGGFQDSYIKLWSLDGSPLKSVLRSDQSEENTRKLIGHSGSIYGISFSPDNRYLLSSSEDRTTKLWSLDTYTPLVNYKGHNHPVWDVKFSPLGHYFATASHDQTARLWSCDHIYPLRIFAGHLNDVDTVEFHPNSTYVFTGSSDKTCRMWDISKGNSVRIFNGHTGPINTMAVSPDGRWLASAGEDSIINIWDIGSGRRLKSMRGHGRTSIYSLAFSKEGSVLVSGGADNSVRVWDIKRGTNEAGPIPEPFPSQTDDSTTSINVNSKEKIEEARRRKEIIQTADHLASFFTKRTPVYKVHFTRGNLVLAAGAFNP
ncbi:Transcription initiation factor TFIID subunit 5 [Wickerhamomyces ciferrii]|uniref:Transcription initiation factor TFIID subunit 5 n=1 Tax=Wickerhamomyces ciferrii (strain ATCC 14091 / BCRC 22168 / CBS 111 / JCM 3599 / NBRC 0793 / NRRL Y-1031 F-60-10) TaxID=1206466 RepID=K0KTJ7_WICCF|nr:Transcription initiation factor TFIID subunit 5 [Wickerhamomyces ciferrii]CCH44704.1 Transcription initiation factor TFIID subunit 5 [Wickerhamomyces ciferrii]